MKIVINKCYGGFGISLKAIERLAELQGKKAYHFKKNYSKDKIKYEKIENDENNTFCTSFSVPNPNDFKEKELWDNYYLTSNPEDRTDKLLIQVIEELGEEVSSGKFAKLKIMEIPDDIEYHIDEYDGIESIHENHRSW